MRELIRRRTSAVGSDQGVSSTLQAEAAVGEAMRSKVSRQPTVARQTVSEAVATSPTVCRILLFSPTSSAISTVRSTTSPQNAVAKASPMRCRASRPAPSTESKLRKPWNCPA
ncbi:hypothetical protein D9M72_566930 [compost metagenome]